MRNLCINEIQHISGGEGIPELPPIIVIAPPQGQSSTVTIRNPTLIERFLNELTSAFAQAGCQLGVNKIGGGFSATVTGTLTCEKVGELVKQAMFEVESHGGFDVGLTPCTDSVAGWKSPNVCER